MRAKSKPASSAASPWPTSTTSKKAMSWNVSQPNAWRKKLSFRLFLLQNMPSIGVITFELRLDDSHSLKDKRHFVKSLKDRLRAKFNVAVAEIDYQDLWQRALVAAVTVSPDQK